MRTDDSKSLCQVCNKSIYLQLQFLASVCVQFVCVCVCVCTYASAFILGLSEGDVKMCMMVLENVTEMYVNCGSWNVCCCVTCKVEIISLAFK